jgi:hypothetical protein
MSKAATIFILPSPPVLEQNEHVVLVDCNFSDNSLVDDQSNVLNALELQAKGLKKIFECP